MDYVTVCQYVGQIFLETRHQIESLTEQLKKVEQERDAALKLLQNLRGAGGPASS